MAASFPTSVKSFTTKSSGDTVQASHINDAQDEIVAIETKLGSGSLENTPYTPTLTNITIGNGTVSASYVAIGDFVAVRILLTLGSTTSISGGPTFSLPSTASGTIPVIGWAVATDSSASNAQYPGFVINTSSTSVTVRTLAQPNTGWSATAPITFASGDSIQLAFFYFAS